MLASFKLLIWILHCRSIIGGFTFHVGPKYSLDSITISNTSAHCTNLPGGFSRNISSIRCPSSSSPRCLSLHDRQNCSGRWIELLLDRSPSTMDLKTWDFDKQTVSVRPCKDPCDPEITGIPPKPKEIRQVTIYKYRNHTGHYATLDVQGCTRIPRDFVGLVRSIITKQGDCIELYSNPECEVGGYGPHNSLEIRPYMKSKDDLFRWGVTGLKLDARSISHCCYKCDRGRYDAFKTVHEATTTPEKVVTAYDYSHFKGNSRNIPIGQECTNLPRGWAGHVIRSVQTYGKCVTVFKKVDCGEGPCVDFNTSRDDKYFTWDEIPIPGGIKSVKLCPTGVDVGRNQTSYSKNSNSFNVHLITGLVVALVLIILIVALVTLFVRMTRRRLHKIRTRLTQKEIDEFLYGLRDGSPNWENNGRTSSHDKLYGQEDGGDGDADSGDYVKLAGEIGTMPFDKSKLVNLEDFTIDMKTILGKGQFGLVYRGYLTNMPRMNGDVSGIMEQVAVKTTLQSEANTEQLRTIMKEAKMLLYVGAHNRLVEMVGCCTENLETKGQLFILLEYCELGSLEKYLQDQKQNFVNIVDKGRIVKERIMDGVWNVRGEAGDYGVGPDDLVEAQAQVEFDYFQLVRWCLEIAEGMEYLARKKVIHGDLAARNVLLDKDLHAKISDFGLSKRLYYYTQYIKKGEEPLPWRWLSIETLKDLKFTLKSDVWMYGVTCWEIFTLGEKPYAGCVVWGKDFVQNLVDGLRPRKPVYCTSECYNVMLDCWEEDPTKRPTFSGILSLLREMPECNLTSLNKL